MSLDELKKRISSIKTTSKITNAMKLVAASKIIKQKEGYPVYTIRNQLYIRALSIILKGNYLLVLKILFESFSIWFFLLHILYKYNNKNYLHLRTVGHGNSLNLNIRNSSYVFS